MKMSRLLIPLLFLLVLVPAALAQTGGSESSGGTPTSPPAPTIAQILKLDTPVTVHLSGTTPVSLTYKSLGNETVSITARSLEAEDVLDPALTVLDSSGAALASNDDHRTNRTDLAPHDSLIAGLTLTAPGRYTVQVTSVDPNAQGDVEVLVSSASAATATPEASGVQTIDDTVPANSPYTYQFPGTASEVVTITVKATDNQLDPKVSLLDSTGAVIATNDDHDSNDPSLGPYDSQIPNFTLPKTDTYTIQINGFAGIGGTFELTISQGASPDLATPNATAPPVSPTTAPVPTSQVIQGTVNANDVYTYNLQVEQGDVYTITVRGLSNTLDPRVSIYLNNNYIIDNDDYGSNDLTMKATDARIYNWIAAQSGTYEIDVRGFDTTSGDFKMTIDKVATGAPTGLPTEQVQLATVKVGETYSETFDAQAGDWVTITARGLTNNADAYIQLLSADGTVLIDNDNNGASDLGLSDARITNYHIVAAGTYTVEVSGIDNAGTFGVTISTLR